MIHTFNEDVAPELIEQFGDVLYQTRSELRTEWTKLVKKEVDELMSRYSSLVLIIHNLELQVSELKGEVHVLRALNDAARSKVDAA